MKNLSIIIPIYNVEKYVVNCIKSIVKAIASSNVREIVEVILIDDGSTDSSGTIADKYAQRYDFINVVHQENAGVAAARNTGISLSRGEYIWLVDSDDEVIEGSIDIIVRKINEDNAVDVFLYDAIKKNDNQIEKWSHFDEDWSNEDKRFNLMLSAGALYFPIVSELSDINLDGTKVPLAAPWDKIVRRRFLYENDIHFNEKLKVLDDMVFSMELFSYAKKTQYIKEEIYKYRFVSDSITHKYTPGRVDKDLVVWDVLWEEYDRIFSNKGAYDSKISELYKQAIYLRIIKSFSISCGLYIFNKKNTLSVIDKIRTARLITKMAYYQEAFSKADFRLAEWRLKPVIILVRMRLIWGVFLLSKLNELI